METNAIVPSNIKYSEHAYWALKVGFFLAPLLAGIDKYFNFMTDWTKYLAPVVPEMVNTSPAMFMQIVGVVEIVAAIGVLMKPKYFAYVVCAWLVGIIFNLLLLGAFYDVALRDLGLAIGAYCLGQLAIAHERSTVATPTVIREQRVVV